MRAHKLILAAATATLVLATAPGVAGAAPKTAGDGTAVCNEAENSHRGGYTVSGGPVDPNPPAFLRGSQMRVGAGGGRGLVGAAEHSPALRLCGPVDGSVDPVDPVDPTGPVDPTTPGDGGVIVAV